MTRKSAPARVLFVLGLLLGGFGLGMVTQGGGPCTLGVALAGAGLIALGIVAEIAAAVQWWFSRASAEK
jgi:hypothetical protein